MARTAIRRVRAAACSACRCTAGCVRKISSTLQDGLEHFCPIGGGQMSFVGSRCEARSACSRDTSSLDAQAHDLIALGKQKIKESVLHKEWGQVATFIATLANWMYLQNAVRTDDFLERHIELLTRKVHLATAVPEKPNPGVVLFYDFFGDDLRRLRWENGRALAIFYTNVPCSRSRALCGHGRVCARNRYDVHRTA